MSGKPITQFPTGDLTEEFLDRIRELAVEKWEKEGTVEFDDYPTVSLDLEKKGAFVQAWVWVDLEEDKK
jgi:hypothetical protein